MCDALIFQGHLLKHLGQKLPVIVEVNEQEILLNECLLDEQPMENSNGNKNPFEDFIKGIQAVSTPPRQGKPELPKCKDFCYLWKLVSEITTLKLQINVKDELLVQQLKIIKVLATRLFIMETFFKKMGKTSEEIVLTLPKKYYPEGYFEKEYHYGKEEEYLGAFSYHDHLEDPSEKEIESQSLTKPDSTLPEPKDVTKDDNPAAEVESTKSSEKKDDDETLVLRPSEEVSNAASVPPSKKPSFTSQIEDEGEPLSQKDKCTSKASSKSVHLLLDNGQDGSQIVEPEKDMTTGTEIPEPPSIESLPMYAINDSLELVKSSTQISEKKVKGNECICEDEDYWEELDKLKEENKMLREGSEMQRLKKEVEEKMRRILELNEENRTLNDMINILRNNQKGKNLKEPPSDSEPMSSDSDFCARGCEPPRSPVKTPSSKRRKLCACREESEKGNESPPFIDVYKREDKGKFISDSSSTVCNEEVCPCLKNLSPYDNDLRARGGNDSNQPCPAGTFPNYQYTEVVDATPVTQAIDSDAVNCGANDISLLCGNKSCQTEGCAEFPGDLGPPMTQCGVGSCLNTACGQERVIGINDFGAECTDRSCPNKDYYPPTVPSGQPYVHVPPEGGTTQGPALGASFPITCTDSTCQVLGCIAKGDASFAPPTQSYIPASDFPITCDDTTCLVPECPNRAGYTMPPASSYMPSSSVPPGSPDCTCVNIGRFPAQIDPTCPCAIQAGTKPDIPIQPAFAPPGVPKTPSICICGIPEECQKDSPATGMAIGQQTSSFAQQPNQIRHLDGKCPRGTCDICACIPFPSADGRPHSGVPPPASYGTQSSRGGRCPRGICDTCACMLFPGVTAGGGARPITAPIASNVPSSYGGTKTPYVLGNEEVCAMCGCQLSPSDIMGGQTCDSGVNATSINVATSAQVMPPKMVTQIPMNAGGECLCGVCACEEEGVKMSTPPPMGFQRPLTTGADCLCGVCVCDKGEVQRSAPPPMGFQRPIDTGAGCLCGVCLCAEGEVQVSAPPPMGFQRPLTTGADCLCGVCLCDEGEVKISAPPPMGFQRPIDTGTDCLCGRECVCGEKEVSMGPPMGIPITTNAGGECLCGAVCICDEGGKAFAPQTGATYTKPAGISTGTTGALAPRTAEPCPDEVCQDPCTCKMVPSEPYFDPDEPRPIGLKAHPAVGGGTAGALGPSTQNFCPDEICQEPCVCKVVPSEPYFDPDEPRPISTSFAPGAGGGIPGGQMRDPCEPCLCEQDEGKTGTSKPSPGKDVAPVSVDLCPDEICEKPCTCKVVPSEGYIDSDTELRPQRIPIGPAMSEKPSAVLPSEACSVVCSAAIQNPALLITDKASVACSAACSEAVGVPYGTMTNQPEVCSVVCQSGVDNPSYQITEKASVACSAACSVAIDEKPSVRKGVPVSAPTDGVCGDSTCARRYPKSGPAGAASPAFKPQPPPGGDDRSIIRCICKSKFCKVIPDPNNPNQRLCVDSSDTNVNREGSACVCATCPEDECGEKDAAFHYPKPASVMAVHQLYKMPKTPESLSKEQEYAGLSRKDSATRRYIAPRRASSLYGIQDDDEELTGNDEMRNADLKLVIANLKSKLLDAEDKIEELKTGKNYSDKDNDTAAITKYSEEMNELKKSLKWTKKEKEEYEYLKQRVKLLEQGKGDTENITSNLQTAVDLYIDTIELLESSEHKLKAEVEQYRGVNEALHENILSMREEMEFMKETSQRELDEQKWVNFVLHIDNVDVHHTNQMYLEQIEKYQNLYQQLMELNYELEMAHVNNLQDLSMMESQFNKYQSILKTHEEDKVVIRNQLKKLTKKNKCYEEVVQFFKDEMSVMSDELLTLQEVLNVTNVSSQEENNKLIGAILQLRRINDRLVGHLCAIEKQAILESQINQLNEARINELQSIISAKNNDLNQHDDIIQDMRKKLNNATRHNADLKKTIKNLTDTVVEIQEGIKSVEKDQMKNFTDVSVVESKVCLANGDLEEIKTCMEQKNSRIVELENQLKSQEVDLILATKELGMLKEKKADSKELLNSLKEQLSVAEKKNDQIVGDYQMVVRKLQDYSSLEHMKNYELNHYKSLVEEMKMSLVQLNNGLEKCEASNIHFYEDLRNSDHLRGRLQHRKNNLPIVFDELKKSMADLKRRLSEADFKGGLIEEELLKVRESHMSQIPEEVTDTQKELEAKIISSIEEQSKLNQLVEEQKQEIERLKRDLEKEREDTCCCKRSVSELKNEKTSSNAQMEISQLKCELNKSLHRQRLLNEENDQVHTQMINLRKKLSVLEQAYEVLKQENDEYKMQFKRAFREKEYLAQKNHDLTKTVEQMRSTHDQLEKQCRYNGDRVNNLELELSETKTEYETVCSEAQNLARVVKMWLQEQNVVNDKIRDKFKNYNVTIVSLRTMMKKMSEERSWTTTPMQQPFSPRRYGTVGQLHRRTASPTRTRKLERHTADARYRSSSPWREMNGYKNEEYLQDDTNSHRSNMVRNISYDSNSSPYTTRSPSPRSNSIQGDDDDLDELNLNDWFSPNYKETDTDADEGDEDSFINKVELMTAQVQEANKRWQKKMNKEHLSKSRASNK